MGIKNTSRTLLFAKQSKLSLQEIQDIRDHLGVLSDIEVIRYCIHQTWLKLPRGAQDGS